MDILHADALYALADMVLQFGYQTTYRKQRALSDGGMSALENAFGALIRNGCKQKSVYITEKDLFDFMREVQDNV